MNATRKPHSFGRNDHNTGPTDRQRAIFDFIVRHAVENLYQPSFREIIDHFGIGSPNGLMCHLKSLRQKGWIDHSKKDGKRAIRILRKPRITVDYSQVGNSEVAR